jgi:prepilin-type N-terminal cleavage/methylation domain-containing protein
MLRKWQQQQQGFTLIEMMIVVLVIGILLGIAVPNFVRAREGTRTKACVENLQKIQWAKEQWAIENNQPANGAVVESDIAGSFKFLTELPDCPSSGTYDIGATVDTIPSCSRGGTHVIE